MSQYEDDLALTAKAALKIASAQARGTLSARMTIRRNQKQILLENTTDRDRWWVAKNFPGGQTSRVHFSGKHGKVFLDRMEYRTELREAEPKKHDWSWVEPSPRIEIWFTAAHECQEFHGSIDGDGKPKWRCRWCRKPMTTTKARALGLIPPLARQRGSKT